MKRNLAQPAAVLLSLNLGAAHAQDPHAHMRLGPTSRRAGTDADERAILLDEMRPVSGRGAENDRGARPPGHAGRRRGRARHGARKWRTRCRPTLRAKLPMEFRQLGASVHRDFDQIALDADSLGDVSAQPRSSSRPRCEMRGCHAAYQIRTPAFDPTQT
jgi:hypothetical protein